MLKKTVTYTDYDGEERTEDYYFNLTEAEITEMELTTTGGMEKTIERIIKAKDMPEITKLFKELILKSYGEKSADGRRFIKNDQLRQEFTETEAYSKIFMELCTNDTAAAEFVNGIIPKSLNVDSEKVESKLREITNEDSSTSSESNVSDISKKN